MWWWEQSPQRRELGNNDDINTFESTNQLVNTVYINIVLFFLLVGVFECCRHWKSIYQNRLLKPQFVKHGRVPPAPGRYPLAWAMEVLQVRDEEFLKMVGLDAYMLIRYIKVLFRIAMFYTFFGVTIMTPLYANAGGGFVGWNRYTLANIPDGHGHNVLWVPVVFCYLFSMFFCQMMYNEYKTFVQKRVQYLIDDDVFTPDTPSQTNYTVMVERIPSFIKSAPMLSEFFEKLFPGQVYCVELTLDLTELELLTADRMACRNSLEKAVAVFHATGERPTTLVHRSYFESHHNVLDPPSELDDSGSSNVLSLCGFAVYDSIEHYSRELDVLNERVEAMQKEYIEKRQSLDELETYRIMEVKGRLQEGLIHAGFSSMALGDGESIQGMDLAGATPAARVDVSDDYGIIRDIESNGNAADESSVADVSNHDAGYDASAPFLEKADLLATFHSEMSTAAMLLEPTDKASNATNGNNVKATFKTEASAAKAPSVPAISKRSLQSHFARLGNTSAVKHIEHGAKFVQNAAISGVEGIAKSGIRTAELATKGALRGVLEATLTLELLTVGAYYKVASTAFVTFTSRVAACSSHQILLSHEYYTMELVPAPNPKDVIWENVSIPQRQINSRKAISDSTLIVGAVFWSIVVTFITAVSNLESISEEFPSIRQYSQTDLYKFLNNYLAIGILLILLAILPAVFDFIARNYEGVKLESQIQNSIMTRFFYYTLANVYVSVGLGSIASSLHSILSNPTTILAILGASLPSFSIYFASLIVVKTFTGIPVEMLRIGPLLQVMAVKIWTDKKKCTRRELKSGAFADTPMVYGWIYPNLLMVLMIMVTYSCISPLLLPMCAVFYGCAFLMYKYQLLYVYINDYQSGGFMWYAVFNRSMVALLCGVVTLVCYLAIRMTFLSGPFYVIFPLPFIIVKFWYHCQHRFERPSMALSLESAMDLDRSVQSKRAKNLPIPHDVFQKCMFRQPSLAEGRLKPMPYRRHQSQLTSNSLANGDASYMVAETSNSITSVGVESGSKYGTDTVAGITHVTKSPSPSKKNGTRSALQATPATPIYLEEDVLQDVKNEQQDNDMEQQVSELLQSESSPPENSSSSSQLHRPSRFSVSISRVSSINNSSTHTNDTLRDIGKPVSSSNPLLTPLRSSFSSKLQSVTGMREVPTPPSNRTTVDVATTAIISAGAKASSSSSTTPDYGATK